MYKIIRTITKTRQKIQAEFNHISFFQSFIEGLVSIINMSVNSVTKVISKMDIHKILIKKLYPKETKTKVISNADASIIKFISDVKAVTNVKTISIAKARKTIFFNIDSIIKVRNNILEEVVPNLIVNGTKIVSWSEGTDEEIVAMVNAAKEGKINLTDYWSVGDERQVTLSSMNSSGTTNGFTWNVNDSQPSQTVTFVLLHKGLYELVTPAKNTDGSIRNTVSFVTGLKNNLSKCGFMNPTATSIGSWDSCERRKWCNGTFYNAIPLTLRPIFARFKTITAKEYDSNELKISEDYFALPAEKEVLGNKTYSVETEANALTQFSYYKQNNKNIIHKNGGNNSSQTDGDYYWLRSPKSYDGNLWSQPKFFLDITSNGKASSFYANSSMDGTTTGDMNTNSISPFGCIN